MDCRRAERNLLRISRLSSSTGLIPSSRDYAGSSYRDYSIRTFPHPQIIGRQYYRPYVRNPVDLQDRPRPFGSCTTRPDRTLGGVVIGYLGVREGVRVFCPRPVFITILAMSVGECNILLGGVAMTTDVESLYASVKALGLRGQLQRTGQAGEKRLRGYQTLAFLFKRLKF